MTDNKKQEFKYFELSTDLVTLEKEKGLKQTMLTSSVTLTNLTDKFLLFKVYINKPQGFYSINPSTSFIGPKDKINISIKRIEGDEGNETFLFSAYPSDIEISSVS